MNVKEKYVSPEIQLAEIKESILDDISVSGIDNAKSTFASVKKRDLFESGLGWFDL